MNNHFQCVNNNVIIVIKDKTENVQFVKKLLMTVT